jgi:hypothetical protein
MSTNVSAECIYTTIMENKEFLRNLISAVNRSTTSPVHRETLDPFLAYMERVDATVFKRCWETSRRYSLNKENTYMLAQRYFETKENTDMLIALLVFIEIGRTR